MDICFITDNPSTTSHPVIGAVLQRLSVKHKVRFLDVHARTADEVIAYEEAHPPADIYLLKSHAFEALAVALKLEQRGALVVNSWASSSACQDRVLMAQRMQQARLPCPLTWSFPASENAGGSVLSKRRFPLMIKSRYSFRGDLIAKVDDPEQLQVLARKREQAPFILQDFVQGDGWDVKLWVIGRDRKRDG